MARSLILIGIAAFLGGCAAQQANTVRAMTAQDVHNAWLAKDHTAWLSEYRAARPPRPQNRPAFESAAKPRDLACDLTGYRAGCEDY
jgi:hypothetical protein